LLAILRHADRARVRTDQLDAVLLQNAAVEQLERYVERRLATHRGQQRVRPLALDDALDPFRRDRLDVGPIREIRIGHDRGRIAVDEDDPVALFLQGAHGLCTGVVELAALPDHDRARAEDENALDVVSAWHGCGYPSRFRPSRRIAVTAMVMNPPHTIPAMTMKVITAALDMSAP